MSAFYDRLKTKMPTDNETKTSLIGWAFEIIFLLFAHLFILFSFGAFVPIMLALACLKTTWLTILLAVVCVGICIVLSAAIVMDICKIIYLVKEIRHMDKGR
ncbi:MAG: hypothetical protein ACI3W5_09415 [Faecousia sp.]